MGHLVMSILKAVVQWSAEFHQAHNIPKGFILLRYEPRYRKNVAAALLKLDVWQGKHKTDEPDAELRPIDMMLDIHFKKRSLDQNALMWALYEIEANELNGGRTTGAELITAETIYTGDMKVFAPELGMMATARQIELLKRTYSMIEVGEMETPGDYMTVTIYVTSSHWNTKEMHDHLEMIFDRLSMAGVSVANSADLSAYWFKWRAALNEQKTVLHDGAYTIEQYRDLVKNCEACGCAVWHETVGSSVAHIKSAGAVGLRIILIPGSDLMHLCDTDHAEYDNGQGRDKFLDHWPHLRHKVETCLGKEIGEPAEQEELEIW